MVQLNLRGLPKVLASLLVVKWARNAEILLVWTKIWSIFLKKKTSNSCFLKQMLSYRHLSSCFDFALKKENKKVHGVFLHMHVPSDLISEPLVKCSAVTMPVSGISFCLGHVEPLPSECTQSGRKTVSRQLWLKEKEEEKRDLNDERRKGCKKEEYKGKIRTKGAEHTNQTRKNKGTDGGKRGGANIKLSKDEGEQEKWGGGFNK